MTDIRKKARVLLNAAREAHVNPDDYLIGQTAVCLAIEQHEAFRQEVSDTVEGFNKRWATATLRQQDWGALLRFIIPAPKPDPLVEALAESDREFGPDWGWEEQAEALRAALEARGLEIREKDA